MPERQRTLRRTLEWSYDLLRDVERTLFARLSVFAGGCTLEAAEAVCASVDDFDMLEGVSSLVENSLLKHEDRPDGEIRFGMLETIREYALYPDTVMGRPTGRRYGRPGEGWSTLAVRPLRQDRPAPASILGLDRR